jgi:uncharacterized protein YjiS (DUF1127 family)
MFSLLGHAGFAARRAARTVSLPVRLMDLFALWAARAHERRMLAALDERALHDLGLSRAEAEREAGKAFWEE